MGDNQKALGLGRKTRLFRETGIVLQKESSLLELVLYGCNWRSGKKREVFGGSLYNSTNQTPSRGRGDVTGARIRSMRGIHMDDELEEAYVKAKRITCHIEFVFQRCFYHYNLDQREA